MKDLSVLIFNVNLFDYEAIRAIEVKNHSTLNGKAIRVMWSRRDPDARKSCIGNVFVKVSLSLSLCLISFYTSVLFRLLFLKWDSFCCCDRI